MGFFIAIIIILLLPLLLPRIGQWVKGYAMGKMEDRMRQMMGMPTRKQEKQARKAEQHAAKSGWSGASADSAKESRRYGFGNRGRNHNVGNPSESIRMMRLYAEDVEYVEIREYSADIRFEQDNRTGRTRIVIEEQLSDAEFMVVK